MPTANSDPNVHMQLRNKAEAQLLAGTSQTASPWSVGVDALRLLHRLSSHPDHAGDALKLLHELQVHQVELDLQNEEFATNEQARAEELSLYLTLYDSAPFGYCLVDFEGNITQGNLAATELFGVGPDELEGRPIDIFLLAKSRPLLLSLLQRVAQSGVSDSCVAEAAERAGGPRHLQFLASLPPGREHILLACCECASADSPS